MMATAELLHQIIACLTGNMGFELILSYLVVVWISSNEISVLDQSVSNFKWCEWEPRDHSEPWCPASQSKNGGFQSISPIPM